MACYRINTDQQNIYYAKTCDIWYREEMAFTGDNPDNEELHAGALKKLKKGDTIFMHQNRAGIVGYGEVIEEWDGITYYDEERRLYRKDGVIEYRIKINWYTADYDIRKNPLPVYDLFPNYRSYYAKVEPDLCEEVKRKMRKHRLNIL